MASTSGVPAVGGLDVQGLVQASTATQQQKVATNQAEAKLYQDQLQGYKELDQALGGLSSAALNLSTNGTVLAADSSDEAVVTATATGAGGDVGSHDITVQQEATFHTLASQPLADGWLPTRIAQPARDSTDEGRTVGMTRQQRLEGRLAEVQQSTQDENKGRIMRESVTRIGRRIDDLGQREDARMAALQSNQTARIQYKLNQLEDRQQKADNTPKPLRDAGDKAAKNLARFMPAEPKRQGPLRPQPPSPDLIMGPGALWISVGGKGFLVNVNPQDMSIAGVRDAINAAEGNTGPKGVTASVVYGNEGARLVLRANEAGADREVKVRALAVPGSGLAALDSRRMTTMAQGQEAQATVDGVQVKSRTNTIANAISGVSLTIGGPGEATISVNANAEAAKKNLEDFATAYNAYLATIDQLQQGVLKDDMSLQDTRNAVIASLTTPATVQTTLTKLPGQLASAVGKVPVVGEQLSSAAASLQAPAQQLQQRLDQVVPSTQGGQFQYLAEIGVALQRDGTMAVDQDALDAALTKNPGGVNTLLTDPIQGAGVRIDRSVRQLRGYQGAIYNAEEALRQRTLDNQRQAQQLQDDLQSTQDYYVQRYSDLNSTINQASATSDMVIQRLGATP